MEITYFCSGLLFAAVVRRQVWDYALTVTLLHVVISSLGKQKLKVHSSVSNSTVLLAVCSVIYIYFAVMMEFPMVWQWWLALGRTTYLQIYLHNFRTLKCRQFLLFCR